MTIFRRVDMGNLTYDPGFLSGHCFFPHFVCTLCNYIRMDSFVSYIEQIYLEFLIIFHDLIKHFHFNQTFSNFIPIFYLKYISMHFKI